MSSMLYDRENLANAKLTASLTTSATTVTVDDASVFSGLGDFYATIMPAGEMSRKSNSEIVKCTYASATTLAITRAQRGTTAKEFSSGAIITNGIYTEDLEQVQSVGNTVFNTSYSMGVYTITSGNAMLPAVPTDGMRITIRVNTDSSGTPGLDLQGTGTIYNIYSGTLANSDTYANSAAAVLLAGETYELVFDDQVGGGCWLAINVMDCTNIPFYVQTGSGGGGLIGTSDIANNAITSAKIDHSTVNAETIFYTYTQSSTSSSDVVVDIPVDFSLYKKITIQWAYEPSNTSTKVWKAIFALQSDKSTIDSDQRGYEFNPNWEVISRSGPNGGELVAYGCETNSITSAKIEIFSAAAGNYLTFHASTYNGADAPWFQVFNGRIRGTGSITKYIRVNWATPKQGGWVVASGIPR